MKGYIDTIIDELNIVIIDIHEILRDNIDESTMGGITFVIDEINSFRSRNNNWIIHFDGLDERLYILSDELEEIICGKWDYKNDSHQDSIRELLIHIKELAIDFRNKYENFQREEEKIITRFDKDII